MRPKAVVETIRALWIAGDSPAADRIANLLCPARGAGAACPDHFDLTQARSLDEALELLDSHRAIDVVLFDFELAGPAESAALVRLQTAAGTAPVIVLGDEDDDPQAPAAMRQGAQDWLPKTELTAPALARAIRHAMIRKQIEMDLRRQFVRQRRARSRSQRQTAELRARVERLDAENRELDDFVHVVSHDLKEPLRGIHAYCELFADDYRHHMDAAGVDRLRAIMAICARLEKQIGDLSTYYRVGRVKTTAVRVDLNAVVDGQVASLRTMIDRSGGAVRVKGPLPTVQGHPVLLGMVFGNLISNGLKYNRAHRPVVEIGAMAGQPAIIYVRDNGIGIAPEHHEAVFDLFRRLHGRKEYEGTGAGLTIVRKIITGYGGRIWLESEPGHGSTFFFTLPPAANEPLHPPHWARNRNPGRERSPSAPLCP